MSALPSYTDIVSLIKKGATIEAQEKIMELREACVALQDENHAMRENIKKLEEALRFKEQLEFRKPFYYAEGDDQPFCPRCWEKDRHGIHLAPELPRDWAYFRDCPDCKAAFKVRDQNLSSGIA